MFFRYTPLSLYRWWQRLSVLELTPKVIPHSAPVGTWPALSSSVAPLSPRSVWDFHITGCTHLHVKARAWPGLCILGITGTVRCLKISASDQCVCLWSRLWKHLSKDSVGSVLLYLLYTGGHSLVWISVGCRRRPSGDITEQRHC